MNKEHLTANSRLLHNLNSHINEDQVFSSISQLTSEVERIEMFSGPSLHTIKKRREIAILKDKLAYSRRQASLRTKQYCISAPEN